MKKAFALLLALVMCLSFVACGGTNTDDIYEQLKGDKFSYSERTDEEPNEFGLERKTEKISLIKFYDDGTFYYGYRYQKVTLKDGEIYHGYDSDLEFVYNNDVQEIRTGTFEVKEADEGFLLF